MICSSRRICFLTDGLASTRMSWGKLLFLVHHDHFDRVDPDIDGEKGIGDRIGGINKGEHHDIVLNRSR